MNNIHENIIPKSGHESLTLSKFVSFKENFRDLQLAIKSVNLSQQSNLVTKINWIATFFHGYRVNHSYQLLINSTC